MNVRHPTNSYRLMPPFSIGIGAVFLIDIVVKRWPLVICHADDDQFWAAPQAWGAWQVHPQVLAFTRVLRTQQVLHPPSYSGDDDGDLGTLGQSSREYSLL